MCKSAASIIVALAIVLGSSFASLAGSREDWQECPDLSNLERAIPACTRIIKRPGEGRENTGIAYNNRCAAQNILGNYEEAISDCTNAVKFVPDYALAFGNRCRAHMLIKRYDEAVSDCNRAIELDSKNASFFFHRARSYQGLGQTARAIEDYGKAIGLNPDDTSSYNNRGALYLSTGSVDTAIADFDKAIEVDPANAMALMNMGRALSRKDETRATFEQASAYLDQALRLKPDDTQLFRERGNIIANRYYRLSAAEEASDQSNRDGETDNLFDRAVADFEKAVSLAPQNADAWWGLANLHIAKEDHARAIVNLDMVIRLAPEFIDAYTKRADARTASGQHAAAIENLSKAIELQLNTVTATERGVIGIRFSQAENGIKIDDVIAGGSAEQAGLLAGEVIEQIDDESLAGVPPAQAATFIWGEPDTKVTLQLRSQDGSKREVTLERQPALTNGEVGHLFYRRGVARFAGEQYELAIGDFDEALRQGFITIEVFIARGRAHGRMQNRERAVEDYFRAVVKSPLWGIPSFRATTPVWKLRQTDVEFDVASVLDSEPNNTAALFVNALLRDDSDLDGKIEDYSRIIEIDPTTPTIFDLRADAYKQAGRCTLAIDDYERATEQERVLNPQRSDLLRSKAECLIELGDEDTALAELSRAIEFYPKNFDAVKARAELYERTGRLTDAIADFEHALSLRSGAKGIRQHLVGLYIELEMFERAIAEYRKLVEASPQDSSLLYRLGQVYERKGDIEEARRTYEAVLKLPKNLGLNAWGHTQAGFRLAALAELDDPPSLDADWAVCDGTRSGSGDAGDRRIRACTRIIESAADNGHKLALAHLRRAEAHANDGSATFFMTMNRSGSEKRRASKDVEQSFAQSIADATRALELKPGYAKAHFIRGYVFMRQQKNDDAIAEFSKAIEQSPDMAIAYKWRGDIFARLKRYGDAAADYRRQAELAPDDPEPQVSLGEVLAKLGEHSDAIKSFSQVIYLSGDDAGQGVYKTFFDRAESYRALSDHESAIADYSEALLRRPDTLASCRDGECYEGEEIHLGRAVSYHAVGKLADAWADSEKAIEIDAEYALKFAKAQLNSGQHDFAAILIDGLAEKYPKSANVFYTRGLTHVASGEQDRALVDFDTAIELNPREAAYYYHRAVIFDGQKQYARAIEDASMVVQLAPDSAHGHNLRAWLLFKADRAAEGLPDIERALQLAPDDAAVIDTQAHIFEALGRTEEAIAGYRRALEINPDQKESREGLERLTGDRQ